MRMPPLPADSIHARACKLKCEKILTRPKEDTQVCRTFFPKSEKDYAEGQPRYTLLKKEKLNLQTGDTIIQYDRLAPRQGPKEGA